MHVLRLQLLYFSMPPEKFCGGEALSDIAEEMSVILSFFARARGVDYDSTVGWPGEARVPDSTVVVICIYLFDIFLFLTPLLFLIFFGL